jgi:hypothetical protein
MSEAFFNIHGLRENQYAKPSKEFRSDVLQRNAISLSLPQILAKIIAEHVYSCILGDYNFEIEYEGVELSIFTE